MASPPDFMTKRPPYAPLAVSVVMKIPWMVRATAPWVQALQNAFRHLAIPALECEAGTAPERVGDYRVLTFERDD